MREIKFRAWDTEGQCLKTGGMSILNSDGTLQTDGKSIVMQFTNLKDKNGKEIYEGDIVHVYDTNAWCSLCETWEECDGESDPEHKEHGEHGHTNRQDCDLYICTQEVKWSECTGYFCAEDTGEYCPALGSSDDVELERVGNIYENPELLK
jgi:uncharacterized phage protein (TIGR01671 family)